MKSPISRLRFFQYFRIHAAVKIGLTVIGLIVVGVLSWQILERLLSVRAGLEFFDEALYVQAASHGYDSATFYHQFPWAWHTRPFFLLVGSDIGAFRTVGGVVLTIAAFVTGYAAMRFSWRAMRVGEFKSFHRISALFAGLIISISSLTFYSGMLRAPSYNWVSLVGFLIAVGGLLFFLGNTRVIGSSYQSVRQVLEPSAALFALGTFFSVPARPTTAFYLLFVAVALSAAAKGWKSALLWTRSAFLALLILTASSMTIGIWPRNALQQLVEAATRPRLSDFNYFSDCSLDNSTGLRGAFETILCVPETFLTNMATQSIFVTMTFSLVVLTLAAQRFKRSVSPTVQISLSSSIIFLGAFIAVAPSFEGTDYVGAQRWALTPEQVTGTLLIWAGALLMARQETWSSPRSWVWILSPLFVVLSLWGIRFDLIPMMLVSVASWGALLGLLLLLRPNFLARARRGQSKFPEANPEEGPGLDLGFWVSASVVAGAFVLGFGSSLGAFRIAPIMTVLTIIAAFLAFSGGMTQIAKITGIASIAVASTLVTAVTIYDGFTKPWGIESLVAQNVSTAVTPNSKPLLLDQDSSMIITHLVRDAERGGWTSGTEIVDYTRSGLLIPLILDGGVVPTLTITLNWNLVEAEKNLELASDQGFDFGTAWLATSSHEHMSDQDEINQEKIIEMGQYHTGLRFPEQYVLVAAHGGFEIWRPVTN